MIKTVLAERSIKAAYVILAVLLTAAFILVPGRGAAAAAGDPVISGHISLPDGDKAGEGGLAVNIAADIALLPGQPDREPTGQGQSPHVTVVIPEGQSDAAYSLSVPKPEQGFGYTVNYTYKTPEGSPLVYKDRARYCKEIPGHATTVPQTATVLDVGAAGSIGGIDFTIAKYRNVSGVLVLPDNMAAPAGGLKVTVSILYEPDLEAIGRNPNVPTADFTIPAGEKSCRFKFGSVLPISFFVGKDLVIAAGEDAGTCRLIYQINGADGYTNAGFYNDAATVLSYDGAAKIDLMDGDCSGLIFPLISVQGEQAAPDADEIAVYVNGKTPDFDVPPIIADGRTLVPVRAIFEALGLEVGWDDGTNTVTGTKGGTTIKLVIGSTEALVNGEPIELDVPAQIIDGRTLVPLRFISESLGTAVTWNAVWRTAVISVD